MSGRGSARAGDRRNGFARVSVGLESTIDHNELLELLSAGDELVENVQLTGLELDCGTANGATFDVVLFRDCEFDHIDFSDCTFRDVIFENCRFTGCSMDKAWLNRVDIVSCSALGLGLMRARLAGVSIRDTDLSYANLSEASIDCLRIRGSRLREAALQRAKLKNVVLEDSDLTRIDVFGTPLKGVDLSACRFQVPVLSADHRELRGAIVSPEQAIDLAQLLGVRIADE